MGDVGSRDSLCLQRVLRDCFWSSMVAGPSREALLLMLRGSGAAGVSVPAPYTCVRNVTRTYMIFLYAYSITLLSQALDKLLCSIFVVGVTLGF